MSTVPFFKIEKDNIIFFILGTDHSSNLSDLPHFILEIISKMKSLVSEAASTKKLSDKEKLERLYALGFLTHQIDDEWHKKLSQKSLDILKLFLKWISKLMKFELKLNQINPSLLFLLITQSLAEGGIDDELEHLFKQADCSLDDLSLYQIDFEPHKKTLEELDSLLQQLGSPERALADYKNKEELVPYLQGTSLSNLELIKDVEEDINLVINRNLHWLPKMVEYIKNLPGPVLFAFGSDHLPGNTGILELLNRSGFKITRINARAEFEPYQTLTAGVRYSVYIDSALTQYFKNVIVHFSGLKKETSTIVTDYLGDLISNNPSILNYFQIKKKDSGVVEIYVEKQLCLTTVPPL